MIELLIAIGVIAAVIVITMPPAGDRPTARQIRRAQRRNRADLRAVLNRRS